MKAFVRVLIILIFFNGECGFAQEIEWQKRIGTNNLDYLREMVQDGNGNWLLGCLSNSSINGDKNVANYGDFDYWIIKTDSIGNILWQKDYGGSGVDALEKISLSNDGSIYCGGSSASNISGSKTTINYGLEDMWVVKLDSAGNFLWDRSLGGSNRDILYAIQATSDGGCVCGGYTYSGISGNKFQSLIGITDGWVVKLSSNGAIEWQIPLGSISWNYLFDIIEMPDSSILCGLLASGLSGNKTVAGYGYDFWVVKLSPIGTILNQYVYGGAGSDEISDMVLTADNGVICGGVSNSPISFDKSSPSFGSYDAWIIKLDSAFNLVWDKTIGGNGLEYYISVDNGSNGDVVVGIQSPSPLSGNKSENSMGYEDYWILKLDSEGEIKWQNTIGGTWNEDVHAVKLKQNGNVLCGGELSSSVSGDVSLPSKGDFDIWLLELTDIEKSKAQGKVFADFNLNNTLDSNEARIKHQKLFRDDEDRVFFANSNGEYALYLTPLDSCNYFPIINSSYFSIDPLLYSVNFMFSNQLDSLNDFAFQPAGAYDDLCMTITPLGQFRPGFNSSYLLNFENVGTTIQSPRVVFRIFPFVSIVSTSTAPSAIYTDSIVWNLPPLAPLQNGQILVTINLSPTTPIGTILNSYAQIFPIANDVNPSCNNATWEVTVTGSFDPNDISVDLDTLYSNVFPNPPYLDYIIRFQNTGTDTAFTVKILNPIDTMKLDLNSLEFVAASHPMEMRFIYHERNMEFLFNNILLPDSNVNEPASHGFVRYKIKPKSNLQVGDSIKNFAAIYFDFNEPVITNTAKTDILLFTGLADQISASELFVYPNPSSQEINIQVSNTQGKRISLDVYNLFGQKVKSLFDGKIMSSELKQQFDISSLNQGVYLLQYNVDGVTKSKKIIKW
jgi:Secretion system C-terminal sorting domain